jgi:LuxR family transcriptional regulator, maltose regulon positive regulatory protein
MDKPTLDLRSQTLHHGTHAIRIGSNAWREWLGHTRAFHVTCDAGTFLARCEPHARGGAYWRAYKRVGGHLRRVYLGRTSDLNLGVFTSAAAAIFVPAGARTATPQPHTQADTPVPASIDALFATGDTAAVKEMLAKLPKSAIETSPELLLASLFIAMQNGDWRSAEHILIGVATSPRQTAGTTPAQLLLEAFSALSRGHVDACSQLIKQAQQTGQVHGWLLDASVESLTAATRWLQGSMDESLRFFAKRRMEPGAIDYTDLTLLALSHQARIYHVQGQLFAAAVRYQRVIDIRAPQGHAALLMALHGLGRLQFERGDYTQARQTAERMQAQAERIDAYDFALNACALRARVFDALNQHSAARDLLARAGAQAARRRPSRLTELALSLSQAEHSLVTGDPTAARAWLRDLEHLTEDHLMSLLMQARLLQARVDMYEGRFGAALHKLATLNTQLAASGHENLRIGVVACQAVALHGQQRTAEAIPLLATVIAQAVDEGQLRMLIDAGPPIGFLLRQLRADTGRHAEQRSRFVKKVCGALGVDVDAQRPVEQFTSRELVALRHLNDGLSNQQIANAMAVSVATAKRHLSQIYQKLHAKSRIQALTIARTTGILT